MRRTSETSGSLPGVTRGQHGFTLAELLIAISLGLMLTGGLFSIYRITLDASAANHDQVQLNYNLRASLDLILSDLRRAGGMADTVFPVNRAALQQLYRENPFMDSTSGLRLWECNAANECSCVTFSYDLDADNTPYTGDMNHFGFRLSGARLQIRTGTGVPQGSPHPGCSYHSSTNTWESLTEDDVRILQFSVSYIDREGDVIAAPESIAVAGGGYLQERNLQVILTGRKGLLTLSLTGRVRVRNDRYIP